MGNCQGKGKKTTEKFDRKFFSKHLEKAALVVLKSFKKLYLIAQIIKKELI